MPIPPLTAAETVAGSEEWRVGLSAMMVMRKMVGVDDSDDVGGGADADADDDDDDE